MDAYAKPVEKACTVMKVLALLPIAQTQAGALCPQEDSTTYSRFASQPLAFVERPKLA